MDGRESSLEVRLQRIEDTLAIGQLPIRYAMAVDDRDVDAWVGLFMPDVRVGDTFGREALRQNITPLLRKFYRSIHQIVGHRMEIIDEERATGNVYCRAEHEVGNRWIVMAIRYDDTYQKVDGQWYFSRRKENHGYAADLTERPQQVDFDSWQPTPARPNLPHSSTWQKFWDGVETSFDNQEPRDRLILGRQSACDPQHHVWRGLVRALAWH